MIERDFPHDVTVPSKPSPVYPTHQCFTDAMEFCDEMARVDPDHARTLVLVHAIVLGPEDQTVVIDCTPGTPTAHAWVESPNGFVWFAGIQDGRRLVFAANRDEYYAHMRVQETTRYTMEEALTENWASGHFGPWRPEYQALCRNTPSSYRCPRCGRVSHHPQDVANKYCGACHQFEQL